MKAEGDAPVIISEKMTKIEKLSVSDAVMKMDLANRSFYIFLNVNTNKLSLVYYRPDGNIAWVELPTM